MHVSRGLRLKGRGVIALAWIAIWLANLAAPGLFRSAPASGMPTASRIDVMPKSQLITCPHHPYGCPKDCFCPKTYVAADAGDDAQSPSALRQPRLAACTSHQDFVHADISLLPPSRAFRPLRFEPETRLPADRAAETRAGHSRPPRKIPIA
jgi:hypothetical protein